MYDSEENFSQQDKVLEQRLLSPMLYSHKTKLHKQPYNVLNTLLLDSGQYDYDAWYLLNSS